MRDLLTVLLGTATGILSGLFGVGGGVISQPGMRLLGLEPLVVIGTALPVIIPGAASGAIRYVRESLIHWPAVVATVPAGLVAAVIGSVLSERVPGEGHLLQVITACLLGLSAWRMGRQPPSRAADAALAPEAGTVLADTVEAPGAPHGADAAPPAVGDRKVVGDPIPAVPAGATPKWRFTAIGVVSGLLSGLLGIGGGVVMVPAFVQLAGMQMKAAIATSLVCVGLFAIPGTVTHAAQGQVDWRVALALVVGVVPGARIGAALAITATDRRLRVSVATFLGAIAVLYGASELGALLG